MKEISIKTTDYFSLKITQHNFTDIEEAMLRKARWMASMLQIISEILFHMCLVFAMFLC